MASTDSRLSYAISYGFVGGPIHSRSFRKAMTDAGFAPASLHTADIIVAHSAGTWRIPARARPRLVIYVGAPLANDQPRETWRKAVAAGYGHNSIKSSFKTSSKNIFYGLLQPRRNLHIIRSAAKSRPAVFKDVPAIFITNRYDPWPLAPSLQEYVQKQPWSFISMPGSHNHIWEKPEHYAEIIKYYARLLD